MRRARPRGRKAQGGTSVETCDRRLPSRIELRAFYGAIIVGPTRVLSGVPGNVAPGYARIRALSGAAFPVEHNSGYATQSARLSGHSIFLCVA